MAEFNDKIITDDIELREKAKKECGIYLQSCLTNEEYELLNSTWEKIGGFKVIPWWKFAFENIEVKLKENKNGYKK